MKHFKAQVIFEQDSLLGDLVIDNDTLRKLELAGGTCESNSAYLASQLAIGCVKYCNSYEDCQSIVKKFEYHILWQYVEFQFKGDWYCITCDRITDGSERNAVILKCFSLKRELSVLELDEDDN